MRRGPRDRGAFAPMATINCRHVEKDTSGKTPKFTCLMGGDELKVKYGRDNGEIYAEVAASRLLWALGFGADRVYPVRVICTGCPESLEGRQPATRRPRGLRVRRRSIARSKGIRCLASRSPDGRGRISIA